MTFHHRFCGKVFLMPEVGLLWLDSKQLHAFHFELEHQIPYKNGSEQVENSVLL